MIIQFRGTSGSGKTTAMRAAANALAPFPEEWAKIHTEGRRQPESYQLDHVHILGHYESACGGCDNIGSARAVFELVEKTLRNDPEAIILCEGLLLSEDKKWAKQLAQLTNLKIIYLTTDVEECITRVKSRRKKAGNDKPLKEDNTRKRMSVIERSRLELSFSGVICRRATTEQAAGVALRWIEEERKRRGGP